MSSSGRILIVGLGNIGLRHLESLASASAPFAVYAVDPSADARAAAVGVWGKHATGGSLATLTALDQIPDHIEIAIVATNSGPREGIVKELASLGIRSMILEKFLFPDLTSYDRVSELLTRLNVKAWVNCPRRLHPGSRVLLDKMAREKLHYRVRGGSWGLACNSIHVIDHLAFLVNEPDRIEVETENLAPGYIAARRSGYVEFLGTVGAKIGSSTFEARCGPEPFEGLEFSITDASGRCLRMVEKDGQQQMTVDGENFTCSIPHQSALTGGVVNEILATGCCGLPSYEYSARLHKALLAGFLSHYGQARGELVEMCPIT